MLQVNKDFTSQIKFTPPDLRLSLVFDQQNHFFCVCRQVDLKCCVVIWSKVQFKLFFLKNQIKLQVTKSSLMNHISRLQKTVI